MTTDRWEAVEEVPGILQAELLRGLLEAQGLTVMLSQEGVGHAYAFTIGTLGRVEILVPSRQVEQARQVLDQYYAGEFADRGPTVDPRSDFDTPPDSEE